MLGLAISVNGKLVCKAATLPNKVLATGVSWTFQDPGQFVFNIGGITGEPESHFSFDSPELKLGDTIEVKIVDLESFDEPDLIEPIHLTSEHSTNGK